jgi:paraquat-inducible protein B
MMNKKVNPLGMGVFIAGAFTILTIVLIILFRGTLFKRTTSFVMYFDGSVNGLDLGSAVKFRGVRIGNVKSIDISYDAEHDTILTPIVIEIYAASFAHSTELSQQSQRVEFYKNQITSGLAAKLGMESFVTGKLFIELDYFRPHKVRFYGKNDTSFVQIPTVASEIEKFISGADSIIKGLSSIDFKHISKQLVSILSNLDQQLKKSNIQELIQNLSTMATGVQSFLNSNSVKNVLEQASSAMANFESFLKKLSDAVDHVKGNIDLTTIDIREASRKFSDSCVHISGLIGPQSDFRANMKSVLSESTKAVQSLRYLLDLLNKTPNAIFAGVNYEQ